MEKLNQTDLVRKIGYSLVVAKLPLCFLVGFSALFGHIFAKQNVTAQSGGVFLAVFLLACGGASLNSYQERLDDGLMKRTEKRPLVTNQISSVHALAQTFFLLLFGLLFLFFTSGTPALMAGIVGVSVYNLIYTRLKQYSLLAIVPGALCGALPPYIGWLAAGGEPVSFRSVLPVLLLILWQIPHVFLIVLNHRDDYAKESPPNILHYVSESSVKRIFLSWISALAAIMITFSAIPTSMAAEARFLVVLNAVVLMLLFFYQLLPGWQPNYKVLFHGLNLAIFLFMAMICIGFAAP